MMAPWDPIHVRWQPCGLLSGCKGADRWLGPANGEVVEAEAKLLLPFAKPGAGVPNKALTP